MSSFIRIKAKGSVQEITQLMDSLRARGSVGVEDPAQLASGEGNLEVELTDIENEAEGRAIVRAIIDQLPRGNASFEVIDRT